MVNLRPGAAELKGLATTGRRSARRVIDLGGIPQFARGGAGTMAGCGSSAKTARAGNIPGQAQIIMRGKRGHAVRSCRQSQLSRGSAAGCLLEVVKNNKRTSDIATQGMMSMACRR